MTDKKMFKITKTGIHNTIMSHITDDIWNKWCLITFATYKNNYKDKPTTRAYCYTLSHTWESDGEYNLWLEFDGSCRNLCITWYEIDDEGNENKLSMYQTPLYLDSESWVKLADYISQILDSKEARKFRWGK